ncbi:MAG: protein kinase [candidate division WOR-3 bacterium]
MIGKSVCLECGKPLPEGMKECPYCSTKTVNIATPEFPKIPGYKVLQFIGEGGMGKVYLARDELLGRLVAIKILSEKTVQDREAKARFLREAQAMASIEHPNIVRVYNFGESEKRTYIVMEYIDGEPLSKKIKTLGKLSLEDALKILRQVISALEAVWERGIVHRDIKPSNILIDKKNQIHITDFGLAKPLKMEGGITLTPSGYILGTPYYVSPEQAQGKQTDFRSDIYSVGIMFYEMLTGKPPFEGNTPFSIVDKHLHEPLPSVKETLPYIPDGVCRLLEKMTQKDMNKRPSSYNEIIKEIDTILVRDTEKLSILKNFHLTIRKAYQPKQAIIAVSLILLIILSFFIAKPFLTKHKETPLTDYEKKEFIIAIAPFYGPDEDSAKEGKLMAALLEKVIKEELKKEDIKVIGTEKIKIPVHNHDEAQALGESLGAGLVIWGETYSVRSETEIQPYFTIIPEKKQLKEEKEEELELLKGRLLDLSFPSEEKIAAQAVVIKSEIPNQIELRKITAKGISDMVLLMAGIRKLYIEDNAKEALSLFSQASKTSETLRYKALALLRLNKKDEAIMALNESVSLDPRDAQSYAVLGDLFMGEGRYIDALSAYKKAAETGKHHTTQKAIFYDGKLYIKETFKRANKETDSGYLLALDPDTGRVIERHRIPGYIKNLTYKDDCIYITYSYYPKSGSYFTVSFTHGKFDRPIFYGIALLRLYGVWSGSYLSSNFTYEISNPHLFPKPKFRLAPAKEIKKELPCDFKELEVALRKAIEEDPTQPWYLFFLGQALWAQGRSEEAINVWEAIFSRDYPAIPYYEFMWMAYYFELFSQREWADKAYLKAYKLKKILPSLDYSTFLERGLTGFRRIFSHLNQKPNNDANKERIYLWLNRMRELTGICIEGDDLIAILWEQYFLNHGEVSRAKNESKYLAKAKMHPFNLIKSLTLLNYSILLSVTTLISFFVMIIIVITKSIKICFYKRTQAKSSGLGSPALSRIIKLLSLFFLLAMLPIIFSLIRDFDYIKYHWSILIIIVGLAIISLFVFFLYRKGISLSNIFKNISSKERNAILLASIFAISALFLAIFSYFHFENLFYISYPSHGTDNIGSDLSVYETEKMLKGRDSKEKIYVLAVINHIAGNKERSFSLYQSLKDVHRAEKNLEALKKNIFIPPYSLTSADLYKAFSPLLIRIALKKTWQNIYFKAFLLFFVILFLIFTFIPPDKSIIIETKPKRKLAISKFIFSFIPGVYDISNGAPLRGYVALLLFVFVTIALIVFNSFLATGRFTFLIDYSWETYKIYFPPEVLHSIETKTLPLYYYWKILKIYPYINILFLALILAFLISLTLHVSLIPKIWRIQKSEVIKV